MHDPSSQLSLDIEVAAIIRAIHQDRPAEHVTYCANGKPVARGAN